MCEDVAQMGKVVPVTEVWEARLRTTLPPCIFLNKLLSLQVPPWLPFLWTQESC